MKNALFAIATAAVFCGCASGKNTINSTTVVGLDLSVNPDNYLPNLRVGYITNDYAGIFPENGLEIDREYAGSAADTCNSSPWELNKHIVITPARDSVRED